MTAIPLRRRTMLSTLALPVVARTAFAQDTNFPTRPVRLVIAFPPGGSSDIIARMAAEKLAARIGQPVVPENRPGAGAMIAAEAVARAAPDGHTIMFGSSTLCVTAATMRNPPVEVLRDLAPINNLVEAPMLLVASRNAPFATLQEMLAWARANPGKLNIGIPGAGSSNHLGIDMFIRQAGINAEIVPYQGNAPQLTALIRGDIPVVTDNIGTSSGFLRDGSIRALAVTSARRNALLPEVPTVAEAANLLGYATSFWFGLLAPKATPAPILSRLEREAAAIMTQQDILTAVQAQGYEAVAFGAEQFRQRIAADIEQMTKAAREAGITT
ncbi:Bug family tripartite tricarboxylate transporter substrate binding protein [Falsiroseomonas sp. HW251]|uniref:Bug family tripartite tricarboxylate transporter substrate binding protein n=1 Tax=Falsiroseomonas sp. HW251 TaxID=3390998 RepID=UPI003D310699